jgi:hypothetical protein
MKTKQKAAAAAPGSVNAMRGINFRGRELSESTILALLDQGIDFPEPLLFMEPSLLKKIPGIGKFADLERAKAHNAKCMELSRRNRQFYLVDMVSVPAKARRHITDDVLRGWRQGDFERLRSWRGGDDLALNLAPKN